MSAGDFHWRSIRSHGVLSSLNQTRLILGASYVMPLADAPDSLTFTHEVQRPE